MMAGARARGRLIELGRIRNAKHIKTSGIILATIRDP